MLSDDIIVIIIIVIKKKIIILNCQRKWLIVYSYLIKD